ncbi:RnfH family protein [Neisseria sp. ZJ106]|uniref:UPF0125 protein L4H06_07240 n=1 Tax=Neisseria lisongii TaxID=2912188 RepID=A0AAW5ALH1_9NEIS|nr:RnfH family protein [Neisseria lisongii]MCF7521444.1 RnfH family protein [Neisseria lisongii]MCF7530014.1 RnfH family protein [Neisseria lisongii]WCL72305.1 RnfH family protein [Neisseria lisongii]
MLEIEIVYGLPDRQVLLTVQAAEGTTVRQAVIASGIDRHFDGIDVHTVPLGIFGKKVKDDTPVRANDRIELYRPLLIDPKEARRRRVLEKETAAEAV